MNRIIDCYNDPYQEFAQCAIKRYEFEKMKKQPWFNPWYKRQMQVQDNLCAWCRNSLSEVRVHVDHVEPLRFFGKNETKNLVLSCARCNLQKFVSRVYVVPDWIKLNDVKLRREQRLRSFRKRQYVQAKEIVDDMVAEELSWLV